MFACSVLLCSKNSGSIVDRFRQGGESPLVQHMRLELVFLLVAVAPRNNILFLDICDRQSPATGACCHACRYLATSVTNERHLGPPDSAPIEGACDEIKGRRRGEARSRGRGRVGDFDRESPLLLVSPASVPCFCVLFSTPLTSRVIIRCERFSPKCFV